MGGFTGIMYEFKDYVFVEDTEDNSCQVGLEKKVVRGLFSDKLNGFRFNVERWCCNVHGCF